MRFIEQFGLPEYDADVLTATRPLADYYEKVVSLSGDAKQASNWIMTDLLGSLKEKNFTIEGCPVTPEEFAGLLELIRKETINARTGKMFSRR